MHLVLTNVLNQGVQPPAHRAMRHGWIQLCLGHCHAVGSGLGPLPPHTSRSGLVCSPPPPCSQIRAAPPLLCASGLGLRAGLGCSLCRFPLSPLPPNALSDWGCSALPQKGGSKLGYAALHSWIWPISWWIQPAEGSGSQSTPQRKSFAPLISVINSILVWLFV